MWTLPFDGPIHMLLYTVVQERATQLNYRNLALVGLGESDRPQFAHDADPILAKACQVIALDEAAHYAFFIGGARLYLYYYPEETLQALVDVLRNFTMPAARIVPNYDTFITALYEGGIFGRQMYAREVVATALAHLGIESIGEIEKGIKYRRRVPDPDGQMRDSALFDASTCGGVRFSIVESAVMRLFDRLGRFEAQVGLSEVAPTRFVPNIWSEPSSLRDARSCPTSATDSCA